MPDHPDLLRVYSASELAMESPNSEHCGLHHMHLVGNLGHDYRLLRASSNRRHKAHHANLQYLNLGGDLWGGCAHDVPGGYGFVLPRRNWQSAGKGSNACVGYLKK